MKDQYWDKLAYKLDDISECHDEKIQYIGAIQSHGKLIVLDSQKQICAISENFYNDPKKVLNLIGKDIRSLAVFSSQQLQCILDMKNKIYFDLDLEREHYQCVAHSTHKNIFIELEKLPSTQTSEELSSPSSIFSELSKVSDQNFLNQTSAEVIKKITNYDRVMIYQFESNGDGYVVAESKENRLEPYLGLRYPAADIPKQARELFYKSSSRTLVDVAALPIKIVCKKGVAPIDIDLSDTYIRAVSPFHVQYLHNMGVTATLSIPIKVEGELWGLIACHHYNGPMNLLKDTRSAVELIGSFISSRIQSIASEKRILLKNEIFDLSQDILDRITEGRDISEAFLNTSKKLMKATSSQGFAMKMGSECLTVGDYPNDTVLSDIVSKLKNKKDVSIWSTTQSVSEGISYHENSVGILAVPLSLNYEDYLIWFRPAANQTIRWAGKASKESNDRLERLTPRGSFNLWKETIVDQSLAWKSCEIEAAQFVLYSFVRDIFTKASDLAKANRELEKIARSKDEFIGMVSHELRTPLNVLVGWIKILKMTKLDEQGLEAVEVLERNTNIQINLIEDLLDISRIISGKMKMNFKKSVEITSLIEDVLNDLRETARIKKISITFDKQDDIKTSGDPARLKQIVWNLVSNAIKYNNKGGAVVVSLSRLASSILLTVSDDGIGISKEKLPYIFDRFVQDTDSSQRTGGLGLGLSIVKSLVELHGGMISASSAGLGRGSSFVVELPIYAVELENAEDDIKGELASIDSVPNILSGHRVLIAEDQKDAAAALKTILEKAGAEVTLEFDGKAAFATFSSRLDNPFDLIISDIGMPEWDGYDFIKAVRKLETARQVEPTPALALTAYAGSKDRVACLRAGFQTHLPKPIDYTELFTVIDMLDIDPTK